MGKLFSILLLVMLITAAQQAGAQDLLPPACAGSRVTYSVSGLPGSAYVWEVNGLTDTSIIKNYGDSADIIWNVGAGRHRITVTEITAFGCTATPVFSLVDVYRISVDIGRDVTTCGPATATFDTDVSPDSLLVKGYLWHDGSTGQTLTTAGTEDEVTEISVTINTYPTCRATDVALLYTYPNPLVYLGPDTSLCGESYLDLDAGIYASYRWSNGENGQFITIGPGNYDWYAVEVTDYNGCKGYDTLTVRPCDLASILGEYQNYITPNGDGSHDTWEINNLHLFGRAKVEIFDRQGRLVHKFDGEVYDEHTVIWDGTDIRTRKTVPMDSYFFVLTVEQSGVPPLTGNISVIR